MKIKTVVTITSKNYLLGTYVMFYSLLKNGNIDEFCFYIMHDGSIDIKNATKELTSMQDKFKANVSFVFYPISFEGFGDNTLDFYKNSLAKFNIFKLHFDEFVFLDSDVLILGDINEIFDIEEDFAAALDMGTPSEFNTGVMHIKKKWLTQENYDWLVDSAKRRFSHRGDQEHINDLVRGNFKVIPPQYNTLKDAFRHPGSWQANIKILHYISKKPWEPYNPILHKEGNLEYPQIENKWLNYFSELNLKNNILLKDRTELIKYIAELYPKGFGVEVGVQEGKFSKFILENWDCETLFLVDPWEYFEEYNNDVGSVSQEEHLNNLNKTINNTLDHSDKLEIIRDYSVNASEEFIDESLDFVYLDARHDKIGIGEDIQAWWPKVAKGGILAGHDYTDLIWKDNHIEVKSVVDDFFESVNYTLDGPYPSWWVKKS